MLRVARVDDVLTDGLSADDAGTLRRILGSLLDSTAVRQLRP